MNKIRAVQFSSDVIRARDRMLETRGIRGVAGDGHVHPFFPHDRHAFAHIVRAVAAHSRAGQYLSRYRLRDGDGARLAGAPTPAFLFLHGPRSGLSSTALRRAGASLTQTGPSAIVPPALR